MIASHYAQPVARLLARAAPLRAAPAADSDELEKLEEGTAFDMLDDSLGWAWGYAGADRRVGYVESTALTTLT